MAFLRVKIFHVELFFSGSLFGARPDVVEDIRSLTEITAVQQVMNRLSIQSAGAAYILDQNNQGRWLYDVYLDGGELLYEHAALAEVAHRG